MQSMLEAAGLQPLKQFALQSERKKVRLHPGIALPLQSRQTMAAPNLGYGEPLRLEIQRASTYNLYMLHSLSLRPEPQRGCAVGPEAQADLSWALSPGGSLGPRIQQKAMGYC